jgi:hypothetical protein
LEYALRVTNFGLHNCDQIFRFGVEPVYVMAAYKTADGRSVVPKTVVVMERSTKLYFTLPKPEGMIYVPGGRRLDVIVTDEAGRFYRLPGADYARLNLKGRRSHTFTLEDVTQKTQTPRDWANLLEI